MSKVARGHNPKLAHPCNLIMCFLLQEQTGDSRNGRATLTRLALSTCTRAPLCTCAALDRPRLFPSSATHVTRRGRNFPHLQAMAAHPWKLTTRNFVEKIWKTINVKDKTDIQQHTMWRCPACPTANTASCSRPHAQHHDKYFVSFKAHQSFTFLTPVPPMAGCRYRCKPRLAFRDEPLRFDALKLVRRAHNSRLPINEYSETSPSPIYRSLHDNARLKFIAKFPYPKVETAVGQHPTYETVASISVTPKILKLKETHARQVS